MKHRHGDDGFAHSMTDLMAGVAVTFLLLAAIFMVQAKKARDAEAARAKQAEKKVETVLQDAPARDALARVMRGLGDNAKAEPMDPSDPLLLVVLFETADGWFSEGQCLLNEDKEREVASTVVPVFDRVCREKTFIRSIVLEGHSSQSAYCSDRTQNSVRCGGVDVCTTHATEHSSVEDRVRSFEEGFANNVRLSGHRAQEVFFSAVREMRKQGVERQHDVNDCIDKLFVVSGRGPAEPKDKRRSDWRVPQPKHVLDKDRRVVLKVRFQSPTETDAGAP